ncbi:YecA/YgfB family protein [Serpentinimonas barnesii]|uniref:YecA/YgfB family protein n=1 Tax=Serpentinimonas barnesii TaxID=1458427 RepID=UPI0006931D08|nr:YecA family protein [Serpentinimonas barnesii]
MNTPRPTEAIAPAQTAAADAPPDPSEPSAPIEAAQANEDDATPAHPPAAATHLSPQELDELEDILLDLGQRGVEAPSWEFLEGFMAGLLCCRRAIEADEYFAAVLADPNSGRFGPHLFPSPEQHQRFMDLWQRRWLQVQTALDAPVDALDDERAYAPELFDLRALLWSLSEEERAKMLAEMAAEAAAQEGVDADGMPHVPAFAQLWAIGFMAVVQTWPEEWQPPRDRELAQWLQEALDDIEALTEDDLDPPSLSTQADNDPPSVSQQRLDDYGTALWAAYDLREIARTLGPRVVPQRKTEQPGRNDPCHCGSGKKFKKCHGA